MSYVSLSNALSTGNGQWRSFSCPDPNHDDVNPSARVNVNTGRWVCMVCGAKGGVKNYVPDYDRVLDEAMDLLDPKIHPKPESWLDQFDSGPVPDYWLSRFPEGVCRLYRFGWDFERLQPCYPLRDNAGRPLGIVRRNVDDPEGPKYKYPRYVSTSKLLFGIHELMQSERLFVCESATTVAAVRAVGFDAVGTYGAILHPDQVTLLASLETHLVVMAYDMDRAGHVGSKEAMRDLARRGIAVERMRWNPRFNDLGDMDVETRSDSLSKAIAA